MRITLDIADDVLLAAKERASRENKAIGEVISELARLALIAPVKNLCVRSAAQPVHGFAPFAPRGSAISNDIIDKLRGEDAY